MSGRLRARPPSASTRGEPERRAPGSPAPRWLPAGELLDPRAPWLLPALLLVVARLVLWGHIPFAAEDAYITFRYARNFAHGFGLVFNPGERVFGFSSPLWTAWLALSFKLGVPVVVWARLSALAAELVTLIVIVGLLRRHASIASAWCFAFFCTVWPYFGAVGVSCMENPVLVGLIAVAAAASGQGSPLAGPALATVALMRPEGVAAAFVLALYARWRERLVALVLAGAGVAALWLYFGNPLPQSVLVKSQLYGTPGPWVARYWWDWLVPFPLGRFTNLSETVHLFLMSVVLAPAVVLGALTLWRERRSPLAAAIGACLVVWLGYAALGVAYFWWYLVVPLIGITALAAVGLPRLVRGRALYVSLALQVAGLWTVAPQLYFGRAQTELRTFAQVARFLVANAQPGEKVMLEPIGMVGWSAPVVVVDEVGLVSPSVARRRLEGPGWYTDVALREVPDWLVVRRGLLRGGQAFAGVGAPFRSLAERDSVMARYRMASEADTAAGDLALVVLKRWR